MKALGKAGIGMLSLVLGVPAVMRAQEPAKPPKQEAPRPEEPRMEPKNEPKRQEEARPPRPEARQDPKDQRKDEKQRADNPPQQHSERAAGRPAGKSVHIPDDKFRTQFGRQHTVVIRQPVIVEGQPRFQYAGYWFIISDPWPAEWAYTDDCYIDYVDGDYFLFDLLHPGVRIALFVTM
jgi:hypothetical protein